MQVDGEWLENATEADMDAIAGRRDVRERPFDWPKSEGETILLRNVFKEDSASIEVYKAGRRLREAEGLPVA